MGSYAQTGAIQFASANYSVSETDGTVTLQLDRVGGSTGELSATIQTFDGTATAVDDYAGIPSPLTLTWSDGNTSPKTVTLPIKMDILEEGPETFTMEITGANVGTPSIATVTIINVSPGTIQFASANYSVSETDGTVTLQLDRVGGSIGELAATIQTFDGTATAVDDYAGIPSPLTLTWSDGNTSPKTVTLPIKMDILEEGPETFTMEITGANVGTPSIATVTITNVSPGAIQFASASYSVSETDGTVTLQLDRVGGSIGELTATIQTFDGTATAIDDYSGIPSPLTLTWSDGNTSPKTVTLPIKMDILEEGPETFTMEITGANVGTPSIATVTITNVSPGAIQFASANYSVSETDGTVTLQLDRVGGSIGELTATIQTFDGTATAVDDYSGIPSPLTLTWSSGNTSPKTVTLPIKTDTDVEGNETFTMQIVSANAGSPATATVTITDVPPGTIRFTQANYDVNESDGVVTLQLDRVGGSIGEITATIQTFDGTAVIVDDYAGIPSPLTLTWSDGNTASKTVTLPIKDDIIPESDENFTMVITSTNPDWVGVPSIATVTIKANDGGCASVATAEAGANQTVCGNGPVNLSATASGPGMWSGGAGSFADPSATSTTYTPAPGELGSTVELTWITADPDGDGLCESASDTVDITFDIQKDAGANGQITVCEGEIVDLTSLTAVPGGVFSGPGVSGSSFDTTGLSAGNYMITYTVNSGNSCPNDTATITVTVNDDTVLQSCDVLDIDFCNATEAPFYNFYWNEMKLVVPGSEFFSQNATHTLKFTEFSDGTALIQGSTQSGSCSAEVYIVLKDKKDWASWSASGGGFKPQGCDPGALVKENLRYYLVDGSKSTITTTGGDCLEEGTYKVTQRPDPFDISTPNLGVHVGPGGALFDTDTSAEGLAGWGWMGPEGDERRWLIDFNFHIDCTENTDCVPQEEVCDGVDNDLDGDIDEGFDSDNDGIPDCEDIEECDGVDNDGDGDIDEGFDSDNDGTPDCDDVEECDGVDNDGDGEIDEGFDADNDGTPDCEDICDGDDSADADGDGVPDACDVCDGDDAADADGDGVPDGCDICDGDDTTDADGDGVPDACDICDGDDTADADGDGVPDACDICDGDDTADADGDGIPDACDVCDGDDTADTDGDGVPDACDVCDGDDTADADGDGIPDACDVCDGDDTADADGDGIPDACDVCDGDDTADADGDGIPDACDVCDGDDSADADGDGVPDACDVCDGDDTADSDEDGVPDACDVCDGDDTADADGDGIPDACDLEECDGVDNDGDGEIDEGFDSDNDGTPDCEDIEECDGIDNDGDGEIDEDLDCDDTPPSGCETAYGRYADNNSCFIDDGLGANRWGWTNYFAQTGTYKMDLYAAAGQCILQNGVKTGEVTVMYTESTVTVTADMLPGFIMNVAHLYVGGQPYPLKNGVPTVANGQLGYTEDLNAATTVTFGPIDVSGFTDGIYIIFHAETCATQTDKVPLTTSVKTYHKPYENTVNMQVDIPYDATIDLEFMDLSGKIVMKRRVGNVSQGSNVLPIQIGGLATEVHIMVIKTGKEIIMKKVYFHK